MSNEAPSSRNLTIESTSSSSAAVNRASETEHGAKAAPGYSVEFTAFSQFVEFWTKQVGSTGDSDRSAHLGFSISTPLLRPSEEQSHAFCQGKAWLRGTTIVSKTIRATAAVCGCSFVLFIAKQCLSNVHVEKKRVLDTAALIGCCVFKNALRTVGPDTLNWMSATSLRSSTSQRHINSERSFAVVAHDRYKCPRRRRWLVWMQSLAWMVCF